ncbi:MAG: hypothetical protein IJX22_00690, partial [Opitutales bacterium]|nr:hypothetical protein [Opitutales bacterium]
MLNYTPKLNIADVLKWILSNQDKTAADFRLFLRGWDDAEEARRKGDERWSKARNFSRGDAEAQRIESEAKANGTWLKAPNGKPSKLNARQWVQVRTKAFKKWFGDWEKSFAKTRLSEGEAVPVEVGVIKARDGKSASKVAAEWAEKNLPVVLGDTEIVFDARSVHASLSHGYGQAKLDAITAIPEGFKRAVLIGSEKDLDRYEAYDSYYAFPIQYLGKRQIVFCRTIKDVNTNRLYVHEVFLESEIKQKAGTIQTAAASRNGAEPHERSRFLPKNILANVYSVNEKDVSKVVDENGEPLVVYHGTDADFWMFDKRKAQDKRGRALGVGWGKGKFYFTISEAIAGTNGKRIIPAFLDVRNPVSAEEYARGIDAGENRDRSIATQDKALVIAGTDGISDVELSGGVAVFSPLQIKSATDNVGTFDAGNPDIRYSRSYRAANRFAKIGENEWAIPVSVFITLVKGLGMNMVMFIGAMLDVPEDYYEAASLDGA